MPPAVGVKKDMKKAAEYLLQAAESGLPEAQFAVAGFYRDGTGVQKDMAAARQWYERAATAGFEPARTASLPRSNKPAVSSTPAVGEEAAPPAPTQEQQAQKTETPPQPESTRTEAGGETRRQPQKRRRSRNAAGRPAANRRKTAQAARPGATGRSRRWRTLPPRSHAPEEAGRGRTATAADEQQPAESAAGGRGARRR